jgi:hypothetical protein
MDLITGKMSSQLGNTNQTGNHKHLIQLIGMEHLTKDYAN